MDFLGTISEWLTKIISFQEADAFKQWPALAIIVCFVVMTGKFWYGKAQKFFNA